MEKEKVNYLAIILAFCVVIAGLGGFWLGTNFGDKKDAENNIAMSEKEIDELGKELFDRTKIVFNFDEAKFNFNFYGENETMNYDSMTNELRLVAAWLSIPSEKIILSEYRKNGDFPPDSCYTGDDYNRICTCYSQKVSLSDFEKSYYKLFGLKKQIKMEEFANNEVETCKLEGSEVRCYPTDGSWEGEGINFLRYSKAELKENEIYVYSEFLRVNPDEGEFYSDMAMNNKIGSEDFIEEPTEEELFGKYGDKASKYKLTFHQDTDDNWYWVSTELIK